MDNIKESVIFECFLNYFKMSYLVSGLKFYQKMWAHTLDSVTFINSWIFSESICTRFFQISSLKYPGGIFSKFELDFLPVKFKFEISS